MNEVIESTLKAKGIPPTAMRILVLEYLQQQHAALSLQDLEKAFPYSDRITLYRTLKTFEEKGLVHEIEDGSPATKYGLCAEACKAGSHYDLHLHFYCYSCKQTYCLAKNEVPEVKLPPHFMLKELNLVAKGFCEQCRPNIAIELQGPVK